MESWKNPMILLTLMICHQVLSEKKGADVTPKTNPRHKYEIARKLNTTNAKQPEEVLLLIQNLQEEVKLLHENNDMLRWSVSDIEEQLKMTDQPSMKKATRRKKRSTSESGGVFVRWGRDDCPYHADLVYSGIAAGPRWNVNGGGSNYVCLTLQPTFSSTVKGVQGNERSALHSVEYETQNSRLSHLYNHDTPCVVCKTRGRFSVLMVPGRTACPIGWTREYYGFLVADKHDDSHHRTEYVCLDWDAEERAGTRGDSSNAEMFIVESRCSHNGGLCGPYVDGYEITCAVCSI